MRGQVQRAVEGILETADASGADAVEEWEVDELLDWTTTLNFDHYFQFWKAIGTSGNLLDKMALDRPLSPGLLDAAVIMEVLIVRFFFQFISI